MRVGFHCAAFPLFGNVDEIQHVDVLLKYAGGQLPDTEHDQYLPHTVWLRNYYASPEYLPPGTLQVPPVAWSAQMRHHHLDAYLRERAPEPEVNHNYEAMQPPTYYACAGLWLWIGRWCGWGGGVSELYWARMFGALLAAAMVLVGYCLLALTMPDAPAILRLGVPALLAVWPQDCFYFISNDAAGAPMGALTLLLMTGLSRGGSVRLGVATGVAAALTVLVKVTHVLVFVPLVVLIVMRARDLRSSGKRILDPGHTGMLLGVALPLTAWIAYALVVAGDMFGTAHKTAICGFQPQTWTGVVEHPIWSLDGAWTFISNLHARFWFGEAYWGGVPMRRAGVEIALLITTVTFLAASLYASLRRLPGALRGAMLLACWASLLGGLVMNAGMSVYWDFGDAFYPSREFPYVVSGRMLTVVMVPFAILYIDGLRRLTQVVGRLAPAAMLLGILLLILLAEISLMWPVVGSPFNFWNLQV